MATRIKPRTITRRIITNTTATSIPHRRGCLLFLISVIFATHLPFATALCGVEFLYPQSGLTFYYLDTVNVTYISNFSSPTLFAWCGQGSPAEKFQATAPKYNGSILVLLDFSSSDPCWFDLRPGTPACGDNSPPFTLLPVQRDQSDSKTTVGLLSSTSASSLPSKTTVADEGHGSESSAEGLSTGAKAGIAIAVVGAVLVLVAMGACYFFRRRKRLQEGVLAGHIMNRNHSGDRGYEKTPLAGSSAYSTRSTIPLQAQPVYDGYPGSMGYDDSHARESSSYLHSPQSPSLSAGGGSLPTGRNNSSERHYLTDRDKLEAARLHSAPLSTGIVSYGPNPVTPSVTPRPSTKFQDNPSSSGSPNSYEEYYVPSNQNISPPLQTQSPPRQSPPLVVSYGPNKITLTPAITSAMSPRDDSVMEGRPSLPEFPAMDFPSHPLPSREPPALTSPMVDTPADNLIRYGLTDGEPTSPPAAGVRASTLPPASGPASSTPLPPYASIAEYYAMEKGAIRKLEEPAARVELPPTRDGYYHFGDDGAEYELQGAAPQNEQQRPHRLYRNQTAGVGKARELDEQKFLMDDVEMAHLREQKARVRGAARKQQQQHNDARRGAREGES